LNRLPPFSANFYCVCFICSFFTITVFAQSPVPANAKLEKLATGFLQPEGPIWVDTLGILFSDIQANKIYRWSPVDSSLTVFLSPSDSSNGLTLDLQGYLVLTQMAKRRIARQEPNGTITPLASTYNGKKFNSPNDIVVKSDGSIFFTDPDFNTPSGQSKELSFKGVFRISPFGKVYALDSTTFDKPNGICFSPDESKLYIDESMPQYRKIYRWDMINDSTIANKQVFFTIPTYGYLDGMKVDPSGNLYCSGATGIWVISPLGVCLDTILTPETPSNCNWGDADRKTLYITAGTSLYRIRLANITSVKNQHALPPQTFELYNNYPNPFNPTTTIQYLLPARSNVRIVINNVLGQVMKELVNTEQSAGNQSVVWHANVASGIYFYHIEATSVDNSKKQFVETKKMLLLK
jgi:gluconolactonase